MSETLEQLQRKQKQAEYKREYRRSHPEYVKRGRVRDAERLLKSQGFTVIAPGENA